MEGYYLILDSVEDLAVVENGEQISLAKVRYADTKEEVADIIKAIAIKNDVSLADLEDNIEIRFLSDSNFCTIDEFITEEEMPCSK